MTVRITRRDFLASTALATGAALVTAKAGWALSIEPADAAATKLYFSACGSGDRSTHEKLVGEIEARMPGRPRAEIEQAIASVTCPVCGCPLVAQSG